MDEQIMGQESETIKNEKRELARQRAARFYRDNRERILERKRQQRVAKKTPDTRPRGRIEGTRFPNGYSVAPVGTNPDST